MKTRFSFLSIFLFVLFFGVCSLLQAQEDVFKAVEDGNLELVKSLVEKNPKLLSGKDRKGFDIATPLHAAARFGKKPIIEYLLTQKADINAKDEGGWSPAHLATYGGFKATLELILQNGGNLEATCPAGSLLHVAVIAGHTDIAEFLLEKGLSANLKFGDKAWTPLHSAAYGGFIGPVRLLVAKNADVRERDADGHLPFDLAYQNGHGEVASFLSSVGGSGGD